jgi:D-alanyl-D-alanine carboxypeptidase
VVFVCKKAIFIFLAALLMQISSIPACAIDVSANAAVLYSSLDGKVLYEKNATKRLPMASTTKVMTAIIAAERCDLDEMVTVVPEALKVEGSSMYLKAGETVSVETMLYGLLLSSGNDAANMLAIHTAGSTTDFVKLMNEKAALLGLKDTHFDTPSGLDGKTHYTTALDLAKIMAAAVNNPSLAKIMAAKSITIGGRTLNNHNKLLRTCDFVDAGKTGFTKKSGRCLVSSASKEGLRLIAVTLNAPDDWDDHERLYSYGFSRVALVSLCKISDVYSIPVVGSGKNSLLIRPAETMQQIIETDEGAPYAAVQLPRFLYAPIENGQKVGHIVFSVNGKEIAAADLIAAEKATPLLKKTFFQRIKEYTEELWQNLFAFKNT